MNEEQQFARRLTLLAIAATLAMVWAYLTIANVIVKLDLGAFGLWMFGVMTVAGVAWIIVAVIQDFRKAAK